VYVQPPAERSVPHAPAQPAAPPVAAPPTAPPERFVTPDITPVAPVDVPATLPDPSSALFAPTAGATPERMGAEAGTATAGAAAPGAVAAWTAHEVEREVVALRGTTPRYPETLARAGVEGVVVARFVVDTIGRVERLSVEITRADHALFEQSVREALSRMRFAPAEARGRKVRQLVEQPFAFALRSR
jgi:periplasmic protein TonB